MNKKQAKRLFTKYVNNKCSEKELELLEIFLESYQDKKGKWPDFILGSEDMFKAQSWSQIQDKINSKKKNKPFRHYYKYAAIFVLLFGLTYFYQQGAFTKQDEGIIILEEKITLQLDNGVLEEIQESDSIQIKDKEGNVIGVQKGNQLIYTKGVEKERLVYSTLNVPYGKHFQVKLSDGTLVDLNAGSSLRYPINFIEGHDRKVFASGELYFNVAKDEAHPFIVNANDINVEVLGTQFNISSYPEDTHINTVLVEGSVSISSEQTAERTLLKPGFLASWDKNTKQMVVDEADIEMHTAWISGKIIFRHISFDNVIRKLERHYNVTIVNNNVDIGDRYLAASFDVETIEEVFAAFKEYYGIDYSITSNIIIIN
ncbi:FecR domain-containing protein [uncultured Wocania sp.]|uniref:FecR family protein n=1 Tax=uncultured Wocania sp. TaxID=2834404 RepID=UPI0030F7B31A